MPKRKNTTLKVPKRMVELHGAYLPAVHEEHRLIVEFPFLNQMQPAVVLIDEPRVACDAQGAGVIFPGDAPHGTPFEDPVLAARIGVVGSLLRREITRCSAGELVEQLCNSSWQEPPFATRFQPEVEKLIGHTIDLWAREDRNWKELECELIAVLTGAVDKTRTWCPIAMIPDRLDLARDEKWRLLNAWPDWEKIKLPWEDRADEFYGIKGWKHEHGRFRSRLNYLHLKAPSRRPTKKLKDVPPRW